MDSKLRIAALAAMLFSGSAFAAYDGTVWQDGCQVTDPKIQAILPSEVFLAQVGSVTGPNADGTYALAHTPYTTFTDPAFGGTYTLDQSSMFYGDPRLAGRSGVLIGPNVVLTAAHANFNQNNFKVIFGLRAKLVNGVCTAPDFDHVPAANVFTPSTLVMNSYPGHD